MTTHNGTTQTTIIGVSGSRSLLILGLAESVSGVGSWITQIAIFALIVFRDGGGAAEASAIWLAGLGPSLLFSPFAGRLADRFDRRSLMIASELACGLTVLGMVFARRLELIYALLALQSVSGALFRPARQAALPGLVADEALSRANAFLQQLSGIVKVGAPLLAGFVLSLLAPHQAMMLDVVSYALSAVILVRLPRLPALSRAPAAAVVATSSSRQPSLGLIGALRALPLLRLLFVVQFLAVLNIVGFDILCSIYVRDVLRGDAAFFGVLVGMIGLGTIGATIGLLRRSEAGGIWHDVVIALALLGCIPTSLALAGGLDNLPFASIVVAFGCLLGGVGNGLMNVQVATLIQMLVPRELLGRVVGGAQSTVIAAQLTAIFALPLVVPAVVSLGAYFGIAASSMLLIALGAALIMRGSRMPADGQARI